MKNVFVAFFAMTMILAVSCKKEAATKVEAEAPAKVEKKSEAAMGTTFKVDAAASQVTWKGSKVIGGSHDGTLSLKSGSLNLKDGNISKGTFVIDMGTMKNNDLASAEEKAKLVGHLSSADFFDVANHPTAKFEVTGCRKIDNSESGNTHQITGNLTLKGVTKSVTIPAKVGVAGNVLTATTPTFEIDRTEWDIKYGSGLIGAAKDNAISDKVQLSLKLVAKK